MLLHFIIVGKSKIVFFTPLFKLVLFLFFFKFDINLYARPECGLWGAADRSFSPPPEPASETKYTTRSLRSPAHGRHSLLTAHAP